MSDDPPDGMTRGDGANDTWALRSSPVATHPHWLLFEDASPFIHCLMGALLLAVGTAGVLGNALVLIVFTRFRRLRGPFSAFIVNLAVADLITSLLHGMVAASCFQGYWMFGTYVGASTTGCAASRIGTTLSFSSRAAFNSCNS